MKYGEWEGQWGIAGDKRRMNEDLVGEPIRAERESWPISNGSGVPTVGVCTTGTV